MTIEPVSRKTRRGGRSRKYPAETLEKAISRAEVIYEREGRHTVPVIEVARHWGYNNHTSGAASTAYSSVRQFGLIDEEGRGDERVATLTDLAFEILRSPDPTVAIGKAMLMPGIHLEMWDEYGVDLPSDRTLHWKLQRESGFTETGATEFLKQYRESLEFVLQRGFLETHRREAAGTSVAPIPAPSPQTVSPVGIPAPDVQDVWRTESGQAHYVSHPGPVPTERTKRHAIPLAGGKQVVLEGDFPLSEAAWAQFLLVLDAFKPGLVEEAAAPPPAPNEESRPGQLSSEGTMTGAWSDEEGDAPHRY